MREIVLDIETQEAIGRGEGQAWPKVSLVGVYDGTAGTYIAYREQELPRLWPLLEHADVVIGYNIKGFDFPVLNEYYAGDLLKLPIIDIMDEIKNVLGFRVKLDAVAQGTLGIGKSGSGLMAVEYFKNGQWDLLQRYCLDDVRITKEVYEYGFAHRELKVRERSGGVRVVPVDFTRVATARGAGINLTMPL